MKKRLCFLTLALLTVAGLSSWAHAQTDDGDGPFKIGDTSYEDLATAISEVQDGGIITMTRNVSDAKGITVTSGKNFTVNFGGHTYTVGSPGAGSTGTETQAFQLLKGSTITFKNGTIKCSDANKELTWASNATSKGIAMIIQNYANLTLDGMTIDATNIAHNGNNARYAVSNNCGTVEFKGATTINAPVAGDFAFDVCKSGSYEEPMVTWNSTGTVTGGIELTGGEFVVTKNLALTQPIRTKDAAAKLTVNASIIPQGNYAYDALVIVKRKGDLTISGNNKGMISNYHYTSVYCAVKMTEADDVSDTQNRAKLTVDKGVTLEGYQAGISGNGNTGRGNTDVIINGGTVKGCADFGDECCGIYQPQNGTLTINGGYIEGLVGVYVKSGSVTTAVKGGTIKGTGKNQPYSPSYNGFKVTGDAIVFDNCDYPGGEPNAEINGGTFTSVHGLAVASYAKEGKTPISPVINGGTFSDESAIKYAAKDAKITVKLQANRTAGTGVFVKADQNQTITFDLNNHTFTAKSSAVGSAGTETQAFHLEKGNTVTIKNGTLEVATDADAQMLMLIQNYSKALTLSNVVVDGTNLKTSNSQYVLSNNSGKVKLTGKTSIIAPEGFKAFDVCKYGDYDAPKVYWNSTGDVTGTIELSGGEFILQHDLDVNTPIKVIAPATLNLGDYTLFATDNFTNKPRGVVIVNRGGDLTVKGTGTIDSKDVYSAIAMTEKDVDDKDNSKSARLTVNGGTLIGKYYGIAGNGSDKRDNTEIIINDGTIKGVNYDDNVGIFHPQKGTLTINGGTIEGYTGLVLKSGTLVVNNGTINGTGAMETFVHNASGWNKTGDALAIENCDYPGGAPNVTISGGNFKSEHASAVASYVQSGSYSAITGFINGGTFSDMSGVNYVAEGGTYKLADNVTMSSALDINSGKKFVVDLNGKTLTGRTNIKHGDVTFRNGTITATGDVQALNVYGSSETTATNYSVVTVASDVTVNAGVYGVCVFGNTAGTTGYGAVANIAGTISTTGDSKNGAVFVSGNLGKGETSSDWAVSSKNAVNIQSTAKIESGTDAALALNGSATVTVEEGAELTGATAIAAKRGKLIVNGGTITGTMNPGTGKPDTYYNGTEMTGSAVSATASYKTDGPLSVELKGGTFKSEAYTILNNHDGCEFQISGGNFETKMGTNGIAVYARLGSVNITGGTFENSSNSEATLHVGCPTAATDGKSPKLTISGAPVVKNNATGSYTHNTSWSPLTVNMANELAYKAVTISGGEFHGQSPEKDDNVQEDNGNFLEEGYKVIGSKNVWTVVRAEALPVVANVSEMEITDEEGGSLTEAQQTAVSTAIDNMKENSEISLVNEKNKKSVASDVVGDQSVGITVELTGTKVSVATASETTTVTFKEFTFDVTPYVVTSSDKTVVSKIENDQITAPMTFRLPIPSSVTDKYARVSHKHDGKTTDLGLKQIHGTDPNNKFIEISTTSFSEFAVKLTSEKVNKPKNLYYYAGNSTKEDGTPEKFESAKATNANAIAFVEKAYANWASTQENVVVIEKGAYSNSYYCPNFVLTDWVSDAVSVDFYTPVDFHVVSGYYTRDNTGNSGIKSMCLPFDLKATDITASGANFGVYHGTDMNAESTYGNVYFNKADEVQAGTPCIVEGTKASTWNITLDGKTIKASINNTGAMKGSYAKELFKESEITQKYKVSTDGTNFTSVTASSHAWPFRAYLDLNYNNWYAPESSRIKELNIVWDDEATGIESIKSVDSNDGVVYDLTGRRVTAPVKGHLYIINGRKQLLK